MRAYRYVAPLHTPVIEAHEFVDLRTLCRRSLEGVQRVGGSAGALPPGVQTPPNVSPTFGTWAGSDASVDEIRLGPFVPPPDSFIPIITGPSAEDLTATIKESKSGRVLAQLPPMALTHWVAWRLPQTTEAVEIEIRDAGRGWGQWMAVSTTLLQQRGIRDANPC